MFDFSFGELALIAVVALLVLGPERLPGVARTAGALVRRLRNGRRGVRSDIERELAAEDLKRSIQETVKQVDVREDIRATADQLQSAISDKPQARPSDESH